MEYSNIKLPWPEWRIVRRIGKGGFGSVYEIERDLFIKEWSALKILSLSADSEDITETYVEGYDENSIKELYNSCLRDVREEYRLMSKMKDCPNIVRCEDYSEVAHSDGIGWDIFIRMELLTPFKQYLIERDEKGAAFSEEEIIKLGKDICRALVACEKENIIHRDIKPGNILVSKNGIFKLGDFGVSRTMEHTTYATKVGTDSYMAPEVIRREPYGKEVDIYSLGLVLYWLLNRRRLPFEPIDHAPTLREKGDAYFKRISGKSLPKPADGSDALKKTVLKACAYKKEDRYQSAGEMLSDLERNGPGVIIDDTSTKSGTINNDGKVPVTLKGSDGGTRPIKKAISSIVGTKGKKETGKPQKTGSQPAKPKVVTGDPPKVQTPEVKKEKTVFDRESLYELCVLIWTGFIIWVIYKKGLSTYFNQGLEDSIFAFFLFFSPVISYILIQLPKISYISYILCAIGGFASGYVLAIPLILPHVSNVNLQLTEIIERLPFGIRYILLAILSFLSIGLGIANAITAVKLLDENNA